MSTEATGDGRTDTIGTPGPDVAVEKTDPSATAGAEREPPDASSADAGDSGPGEAGQALETDDGPEALEPDEAGAPAEIAGSGEAAGDEEHRDDEGLEYGEALEHDGGYGEALEHDGGYGEALEHDGGYEEYGDYEPEEGAGPQRVRRWPRVLLAAGFAVLAAAIVGGAIAIVGSVTHGFKKPDTVTYKKSALFSLKTGECFDPRGQSYSLIACDSPHDAEVFATFTLSGPKWPGAAAVAKEASSGCASRLTGYLNPQLAISLSSTYVYPDSVAWQAGTKTVICEVRAASGQLTGSVRGAATAG